MARVRKRVKPKIIATDAELDAELDVDVIPSRASGEITAEDRIIAEHKARIRNPLTAIRAFCVECLGGMPRAVSKCPSTKCSLHPFRMGKNTMHGTYGKKRK